MQALNDGLGRMLLEMQQQVAAALGLASQEVYLAQAAQAGLIRSLQKTLGERLELLNRQYSESVERSIADFREEEEIKRPFPRRVVEGDEEPA